VRVYAVLSEQMGDEALELSVDRQMAELWSRTGTATSRSVRASFASSRSSSRPQ
jgi:hypothetical protein